MARKIKYVVRLVAEERAELEAIVSKGRDAAGRLLKARILLKADISQGNGWRDEEIVAALDTSMTTVYRVREAFVEQGVEAAISRKKRLTPPVAALFDGEGEARLIQLACSEPPAGHARWTLRLLERKVIELGIVEAASDSTIGRVLKKTSLNLTVKSNGLSRPAATVPS